MSLLSKYWKVVFFTDNIYINLLLPLVYNGNIMMTNDFILDLALKGLKTPGLALSRAE